jgi:hypothetical protein
MALTSAQLRAFINKNFLSETPVNNIRPEPVVETDADPFLPDKTPSMNDVAQPNIKRSAVAEYKYLDDVILSNNLVLFPRNLAETYTIHLCLFSINTDLHTPFLQFMFSKTDSVYQFPNAELDMASIQKSTSAETIQPKPDTEGSVEDNESDEDEYDESSGIDAEFLSQCSDLLQKTMSIPDMEMQSRYRGFLEDDQNANQLYVFFDCTGLNIETNSDKFQTGEYIMAIVDELNAGRINNVEISSAVLQIFNNNPFIKIINTVSGEPVPSPIISYLCTKNEDETYANEYYTAENGYDNVSLIAPVVTHAMFDDIYMFSKSPLTGEYNNIKRFALFYDETEDDVENMDNESDESSEEESVEEDSSEEETDEEGEEGEESSIEEGDEESIDEEGDEESIDEEGDEESIDEEGDEESIDEDGDEESIDEEGEEESMDEDGDEESVEEGEEESVDEDGDEESVEEGEEESVDGDEEESGEETESSEEGDESSSGEESGTESGSDSGSSESSDESSISELELAENAVFTFKETEKTYYGTYSLESFTEL